MHTYSPEDNLLLISPAMINVFTLAFDQLISIIMYLLICVNIVVVPIKVLLPGHGMPEIVEDFIPASV
jgi:hypothetical protein